MAETQDRSAIDPTVPLQGIPKEYVKTAEWEEVEEVITAHGFERKIQRRYPKINGEVLNEMTSPVVWRKVLDWFPKVPVMIAESDDERDKRLASRTHRAAEPIIWNGVRFTLPKGVAVLVPQPIADLVNHANETYRTVDVQRIMQELEAQERGE